VIGFVRLDPRIGRHSIRKAKERLGSLVPGNAAKMIAVADLVLGDIV
jgi:hypothetical protein